MKNLALLTLAGLAMTSAKNCNRLTADTGAGAVEICGPNFQDNGSICTYTCTNGETRTVQCLKGAVWSTLTDCSAPAPSPAPPAPSPAPPAPSPAPPAALPCASLNFNTGVAIETVCADSPSGTICNFACNSANPLETRRATCTNGVWSTLAACPQPCSGFSVDDGLNTAKAVCSGTTVDSATCSYTCAIGLVQTITCVNGAFTVPATACPIGTNCGGTLLFPTGGPLINQGEAPSVTQDLPDKDRFRVEWVADTTAGGLAGPGDIQILGNCAVDQSPTIAGLAAVFVSGQVTFKYDLDTITWDFGVIANPIFTATIEPYVVLADNAAGTALFEFIWIPVVDGFPALQPVAPIFRVQASALAFPKGWPANTNIVIDAEINLQLQGRAQIFTYTTSTGTFTYGTLPTGDGVAPAVAAGAVGVFALASVGFFIRKRALELRARISVHVEDVPELETIGDAVEFETKV